MSNHTSALAIVIFLVFVGFTLGLSFYLGRRAKTAGGYFAAHGEIGWFVNGIAFAGDYLSAASFLGIVGIVAFNGFDGFLYCIGFLAGWVVALFLVAEPFKRLGKYTFADALNSKFDSPGIRVAAAVSTLVVSMLYLIPQMVGAGALVRPLLGIEHYWGVLIVGGVVITIVTTAGMVSTTWVQFIKGSMLVLFCTGLVIAIVHRGVDVSAATLANNGRIIAATPPGKPSPPLLNRVNAFSSGDAHAMDPTAFLRDFKDAHFLRVTPAAASQPAKQEDVAGADLLLPGNYYKGLRSPDLTKKFDFISLMLALFCGTASLPHVMIRYYTVKDAAAARKSTVVGIAAIGFFYVLMLFVGLGAMVGGNLDPTDNNMSAPLLARTFGEWPFALLTAIAFTTVLGTVSGLILASAGAVAHDLAAVFARKKLAGDEQVRLAKFASVGVGIIAIGLGILCRNFNVGFLVAWAFAVAASANLPAIIMLLFWRGTTKQGMIASISVGLGTSVVWLLLTKEAFQNVYGMPTHLGYMPFSQPGLVTIPLSFVTLVVVSLLTRTKVSGGIEVV